MDVREKTSNEKRLIDANAFLKDILTAGIGKTIIEYSESDIGYMIRKRPTVYAVEVVRCKDCKYYCQDKINGVICRHPALDFDTECFDHWINTNPDDFCSYGERKEGAK